MHVLDGEQCFLDFLDCEERDSLKSRECLAYGSIQAFSSGCILDLNLELCCCRKCLRDIAYYEWAKKVLILLENTESRKNRLICEPQFPESTVSTHLGHTTLYYERNVHLHRG